MESGLDMKKIKKPITWVKKALNNISLGKSITIKPLGGSMRGRIESGQLVTLIPINLAEIKVNDVVFVQWKSSYLLHLVKEIKNDKFLIGNNLGKINGWVCGENILAKAANV